MYQTHRIYHREKESGRLLQRLQEDIEVFLKEVKATEASVSHTFLEASDGTFIGTAIILYSI